MILVIRMKLFNCEKQRKVKIQGSDDNLQKKSNTYGLEPRSDNEYEHFWQNWKYQISLFSMTY